MATKEQMHALASKILETALAGIEDNEEGIILAIAAVDMVKYSLLAAVSPALMRNFYEKATGATG